MKIKVLLFGELAQIASTSELHINEVSSVDAVNEFLCKEFPSLNKKKYVIAVNKQIINGDLQLNNGDEVALLPPFSGG